MAVRGDFQWDQLKTLAHKHKQASFSLFSLSHWHRTLAETDIKWSCSSSNTLCAWECECMCGRISVCVCVCVSVCLYNVISLNTQVVTFYFGWTVILIQFHFLTKTSKSRGVIGPLVRCHSPTANTTSSHAQHARQWIIRPQIFASFLWILQTFATSR